MSACFDTMTAMEMRRRVTRKDVSPVELTRRALAKAEATQKNLNAFFVLFCRKRRLPLPERPRTRSCATSRSACCTACHSRPRT